LVTAVSLTPLRPKSTISKSNIFANLQYEISRNKSKNFAKYEINYVTKFHFIDPPTLSHAVNFLSKFSAADADALTYPVSPFLKIKKHHYTVEWLPKKRIAKSTYSTVHSGELLFLSRQPIISTCLPVELIFPIHKTYFSTLTREP
jgi:hypothetical protein